MMVVFRNLGTHSCIYYFIIYFAGFYVHALTQKPLMHAFITPMT